ncbi:MAG: DUF4981 domain-containing protein [Acidimicrobiaceae bacterium]|nr:DUF4981 domain-containing protein [Acidimicrobiaceae bacterium]MDE0517008.1 DUF4981 domain-containing protein [Acidimicrobiaceae bacterium]
MLPVLGELRPWADPTVLQMNRLAMHVPLTGFRRQQLDGVWSLELFDSPDDVPADALTGIRPNAVRAAVPGNWTMQDLSNAHGEAFVDKPHYTNVQMPFDGPPPRLPDRNPAGVYRRTVTVPTDWQDDRTVLHVGGAESVHAVYVNGRFAGYGTDSRLPSEYEIGRLLTQEANDLAIVVVRYSAHSYIEDQDQWWMAGLHRSVWIESRPRVHIGDIRVATDFDPATGAGTVAATAAVDFGVDPAPGWSMRFELHDPTGRPSGPAVETPVRHQPDPRGKGSETGARWDLTHAEAWSAETPRLYTLAAELVDPGGSVIQSETQRVGLRRVEVRDRQLLVNGQPIRVFGVNRHDHHPDTGKAVTVEDMRDDLRLMRLHNINAVRTSHYPNDDAFYALCDELGFYVVDEANIEGHAYEDSICDDAAYRDAFVDRGARIVQRDRNHPSVIVWSLGNETGYGANHDALAAWIREADPTRPLHYEPAINLRGWEEGGETATDIVCPMYPQIDAIRSYGEAGTGRRPLIMCEYSHAMGNSNGSLADYWDVIEATPGLQGGFLWEWKDQALRQRLPDGTVRLAYGGQFGDAPHDGNFVADGLVSADLEPHPAMREVAWVYRPVVVTGDGRGLRIENRRAFTGLAELRAGWELLVDGEVADSGVLAVPEVAGHASATIPLPEAALDPDLDRDAHLTVRWETVHDTWFAPAGHVVSWDQVELACAGNPARRDPDGSPADHLVSPTLNLWRAPTDNDGFKLMPELSERLGVGGQALRRWRQIGLHNRPADELVAHRVQVERDDHGTTYRHTVEVPEALADLPRIGVQFELPPRFRGLRWYGRGPHENYPDRNWSATMGVWHGPPDELPYLVPQEFGLRTGCRWFEIIDPEGGEAVRIDALQPSTLSLSAIHYRASDLFEASTQSEVRRRDGLVVCLDAAHRGLGTASCGPGVLPEYRIASGRHEFAYRVSVTPA